MKKIAKVYFQKVLAKIRDIADQKLNEIEKINLLKSMLDIVKRIIIILLVYGEMCAVIKIILYLFYKMFS